VELERFFVFFHGAKGMWIAMWIAMWIEALKLNGDDKAMPQLLK